MSTNNQKKKVHILTTPEGVELPFTIAGKGERLGALIIDIIFIFIIQFILLIIIANMHDITFELRIALLIFLFFIIRNGYFTFFEILLKGMTPAKKMLGLRVINQEGGNLNLKAVIVRNVAREIEVFLPLSLFLTPLGRVAQELEASPLKAFSFFWLLSVTLVIFINKRNRRAGDLIAGTLVVTNPPKISIHQITSVVEESVDGTIVHSFTDEHLKFYGEFELQKLEYVLRSDSISSNTYQLGEIADSIKNKIGWEEPIESELHFLQDFYKAQRKYLEHHMLFGKRRASKYDTLKD